MESLEYCRLVVVVAPATYIHTYLEGFIVGKAVENLQQHVAKFVVDAIEHLLHNNSDARQLVNELMNKSRFDRYKPPA
jgi:hypothetical protein